MGYIRNVLAGSLRSGVTKTLAVILGDISNPHFSILVKEIETAARKYHYSTFILNTDESSALEEEAIRSALGKKVDGIILCPTQKNKESVAFLQRTGIPFVLIGRYFKGLDTDYVVCDDVQGGYLATRHLISKGHRDILFLNGPDCISSAKERLEGYGKALSESGIPFRPALVRKISVTSGQCGRIVTKLLQEKIAFTAIFAFSDMIAWEAIHTLNRFGKQVPQDIAVVGFDNIQSKLPFPVPLTTISTYKSRMSRHVVDILMKKISARDDAGTEKIVIETKLVVRGST
jgi:LacI family transcriptional regulator